MGWRTIVHVTTIVWLCMFVVGFFAFDADLIGMEPPIHIPDEVEPAWDAINWTIWGVFVIDVYLKYRRSPDLRTFVRKNWLDLLLLFPFFRVLLILRVIRLIRMVRVASVGLEVADMYFSTIQRSILYVVFLISKKRRGDNVGKDTDAA